MTGRGTGAAMNEPSTASDGPPPPPFRTWRRAYWLVAAAFALEVALLYAFTLRFS